MTTFSFSTYLRAHKKEPLLSISVISAVMIAISNLILGKYFGAIGMAGGYLLVNLIMLPFILLVWYRCRATWHGTTSAQRLTADNAVM